MTELTNIFARSIKDLTLIPQLPSDLTVLDQVKIPVGNLPAGVNGCEALSFQQLRIVIASDLNKNITNLKQTVNSKISENQKLVDSKLLETKTAVDSSLAQNKSYTDQALLQLSTQATKFYPTLALANADISSLAVNQAVNIGEAENGGLWYKATAEATSLTKSPYDPLEQVRNAELKYVGSSESENLYEWKDNAGNVVLALNKKGQLVSYDENTKRSILLTNQEDIKELQKFVDELNLNNISVLLKLLATNDSSDLYTFDDNDGNIVLRLTKSGMLRSGQIDGLHNAVDALEYLKKLTKQSDDSKLIRFEDAEKNLLGYIDKFGNLIFNGVDVLNEINELKKFKNKAQAVTALKQVAVKAPESLIQIYLTDIPALPDAKGTVVTGKGEFHFDGQSFSCYVKLEVQGSSSAAYAKKNWNIAFFSDQALTKEINVKIGDLLPHDELVFKSNWIDHTNTRNAMCYRLWEQFTASRTGYPRLEVEKPYIGKTGKDALQNGANGVPRLYPALLYINDEFYGIGSFGTAKKRGNYNIAKNKPKEILIGMDGWNDITNLEVNNPTQYGLKAPSSPTVDTFNAISNWNTFAQLSDTNFATQAVNYLDKQNVIDFMIFAEFVKCGDVVGINSAKNFQFISYDGKRFMFMPYDMDTVFGLLWSGAVVYDDTTGSLLVSSSSDSFWRKVKLTYNADIEARYKQLRNLKIISVENIYNLSTDLSLKYSKDVYDLELARWPVRPSLNITSLEQILTWTKKRIAFLDTYFNYTA